MCGIGVILAPTDGSSAENADHLSTLDQLEAGLVEALANRGPDASNRSVLQAAGCQLTFLASVLHIQGVTITQQPVVDVQGNLLLWNGEVFGGYCWPSELSDTLMLSRTIAESILDDSIEGIQSTLMAALGRVQGPWAMLFYHPRSQTVYFARDPFGRRSLLTCHVDNQLVALASTSTAVGSCQEVPIGGIYALSTGSLRSLSCMPWPDNQLKLTRQLISTPSGTSHDEDVSCFLSLVMRSLTKRLDRCQQPVGVLFSGGIDSLLLAACLHLCLDAGRSIELLNIVFQSGSSEPAPDRLAAIAGLQELQALYPGRHWQLIEIDVSSAERAQCEQRIKTAIAPLDTHMDLNIGSAFWFASRGIGHVFQSTEQLSGHHLLRRGGEDALRSVGLDAEKLLLRDLRANHKNRRADDEQTYLQETACGACQRIAKIGCVNGFCKKCCDRQHADGLQSIWKEHYEQGQQRMQMAFNPCPVHAIKAKQMVQVKTNVLRMFQKMVEDDTVDAVDVDDGTEEEQEEGDAGACTAVPIASERELYRCQCKVLIVGIGADEQLAGYGRHRTVYQRGGEEALIQELNMDLTRLWTRNLGRDDRCISDHGREAWFPYLDEELVAYVQSLPLAQVADLNQPQGVGDKKILRDAARSLGLVAGADLVKRAIQFGSLAAKQTSEQYFGSRRKGKGQIKI